MPQDKGKKLVDLLFGQPDQAAFGVFPQMKPRRSKQDPEAAKNVPVDLARGIAAGALGAPGDIESLIRLLPGLDEKTILPTSEEILKRIPGGSDTPTSRAAAGAGTLAGGFYTGPGSGVRAALSLPSAIKRAGQDFAMAAGQSGSKIFIGPKAKTWNQAAADLAVQLEKSGADPVDIWRQTGTFRGADGLLRQEIDDRSAFFPGVGLPDGREHNLLGGTIFHPQQRKAYPDLSDTLTTTRVGRSQGMYTDPVPATKDYFGVEEEILAQGANRKEIKKILLHEMQHAIQEREGTAKGGMPSNYLGDLTKQNAAIDKKLKALDRKINKNGGVQSDEQRQQWLALMDQKTALSPDGQYRRLAGEAESRAVEKRMDYTPEQRRSIFPLDDYDVPVDQLIVRGESNGPALATVYHGSPHKFEKFDPSKIGTGEGAQAYGHGMYFAESPKVAEGYKHKLSDTLRVNGEASNLEQRAAQMALTFGDNTSEGAIKWLSKYEGKGAEHTAPALTPELIQSVKQKFSNGIFSPGGHLYTVDLPDEKIARMLDWDKPLSQQPEVIKALKGTDYEVGISQKQAEKIADQRLRQEADEWAEMSGGDPVDYINNADWEKYVDQVRKESGNVDSSITGADLHKMIMRDEGYRPDLFDPENYQIGTSEALRQLGVPGIKYLDRSSRQAGEGTRNFVVFPGEEEALTILERKKKGGSVRISDNPDTMRMELAGGGTLSKAAMEALSKVKLLREEMAAKAALQAQYAKEMEGVYTKDMPTFEQWKATQEQQKADGGEVTIPDMTDGGKVIDGGPFKKGGKVRFTDNLDAMRMAVGRK